VSAFLLAIPCIIFMCWTNSLLAVVLGEFGGRIAAVDGTGDRGAAAADDGDDDGRATGLAAAIAGTGELAW